MSDAAIGGLALAVILMAVIMVVSIKRIQSKFKIDETEMLEKYKIDEEAMLAKVQNMANTAMQQNADRFKTEATEPMRQLMTSLQGDIQHLKEQSVENTTLVSALSSHTSKIADMLSNTKKRGDFGEMTIERWLDAAGLQKGIHYDTQVSLAGGTSRPDFIINLPEDRCIILDSKTPLAKLTQAFDDDIGEEAQSELLKEHRKAIEKHITDLGNRDYSAVMNNMSNMPAVIDYTIMIVPEYSQEQKFVSKHLL